MDIEKKRNEVLLGIYDEMSRTANSGYEKTLADIVKAMEGTRTSEEELRLKQRELDLKEREIKLKEDIALLESANAIENRKLERIDKVLDAVKIVLEVGTKVGLGIFWSRFFASELTQTRLFEVENTETSAASRWLKNSLPKVKLF